MQYLLDEKKASARAHIYYDDKDDTACRMYSTGGLRSKTLIVTDEKGERLVCKNCNNMHNYNESMGELIRELNVRHATPVPVPYPLVTNELLTLEAVGLATLLYAVTKDQQYRFEISHIIQEWYFGDVNILYRALNELSDNGFVRKTGFTEYELTIPDELLYKGLI